MNTDNLRILYEIDKKLKSRLARLVLEHFRKDASVKDLPLNTWQQHFLPSDKWDIQEELWNRFDNASKQDQEEDQVRDFRVRCLTVNNFRKFPELKTPFGLELQGRESADPCSLILLGKNGVGKSSLFAAFEYVFGGMISEARLRNYEVEDFASHSDREVDASSHQIRIFTKEGVFTSFQDFKKSIGELSVNPFFCSEWDIISIGQRSAEAGASQETVFHDFFAENLGFAELVDLKQVLAKWQKRLAEIINQGDSMSTVAALQAELAVLDKQISEEKESLVQLRKSGGMNGRKIRNFKKNVEKWTKDKIELKVGKVGLDLLPAPANTEEDQKKVIAFLNEYIEDLRVVRGEVSKLLEQVTQVTLVPVDTYVAKLRTYKRELDNIWIEMTENDKLKLDILLPAFLNLGRFMENRYLGAYLVECASFVNQISEQLTLLASEKVQGYTPDSFDEFSSLIEQREKLRVEIDEAVRMNKDNIIALHDNLKEYGQELEKALDETTRDAFSLIRQTIRRVMGHFVYSPLEKEEIDIRYTQGGKISVQIRYEECKEDKSGSGREKMLTPRKYYNTFRYKLFCMMLKLSVALVIMKRYRINFPIILDDVFYASDYYNRELITLFVKELNTLYRRIWGNRKMKMQLICFTHDELVFDAIETAMEKENLTAEVLFGRLLDYKLILNAGKDKGKEMQECKDPEENIYYNLYLSLFD